MNSYVLGSGRSGFIVTLVALGVFPGCIGDHKMGPDAGTETADVFGQRDTVHSLDSDTAPSPDTVIPRDSPVEMSHADRAASENIGADRSDGEVDRLDVGADEPRDGQDVQEGFEAEAAITSDTGGPDPAADLAKLEPGGLPVDCSPIAGHPKWSLCKSGEDFCEAVFYDGAGCSAVCASVGLPCARSFEDLSGQCAPDLARPELHCGDTGHQSDYCVCSARPCEPDCTGKTCGSDGCGGSCGQCPAGFGCFVGGCYLNPEPGKVPAFPGAEGEGMYSLGGRGGDLCRVTNTDDSGPGSLRDCVAGSGPRTVIFDVGGIITLKSPLNINRSHLTIAGQTAPGGGITIRGYQVVVNGDHTVIRHLRFRAGDIQKKKCPGGTSGFTEDSITINADHVILDHVSASWGIDECLSGGSAFSKVTVQYSIVSEGLHQTGLYHGDCNSDYNPGGSKGHSMGSLFKPSSGNGTITVHHNLYAMNNNRNPAIGTYETDQTFLADIRNNVIYNCPNMGYSSGESKWVHLNYVGNYGIFGPISKSQALFNAGEPNHVTIYQSGNYRDLNKNGKFDGQDDGWASITGEYSKASSPFPMMPVTTQTAPAALTAVLENAGATPWNRDAVDTRIVDSVKKGTGKLINSQDEVGGWGVVAAGMPPVDSDLDGMPDAWEAARGLDPSKEDQNLDRDGDGLTNLEEYLHDCTLKK